MVVRHSTGARRAVGSTLNLVGVCCLLGLIILLFSWSWFPFTVLRSVEILVAAYYTFVVVKRDPSPEEKSPVESRVDSPFNEEDQSGQRPQPGYYEKKRLAGERRDTIGCVVGWREEDQLLRECLQSLRAASCLSTLVVGVDGDSEDDRPMLSIFREVFPNAPQAVHFDRPVGECLEFGEGLLGNRAETDLDVILDRVESKLVDQIGMGALLSAPAICVYQPHQCKKSILFSAFLVALVLSRLGKGEYTWSSDSDSVVQPGAIEEAIVHMREHPEAGGAAGRLKNRPCSGSMISKVIGSKYWFDQDVTRAQTAISGDAECQPGPCTVTRVEALREVVVEWYNQRFLGRRVITNEDRHLTTRLIRRNWKVYYIPQAVVETDSPVTLFAWIRQQNRWSRGTHIERFSQPLTYVLKSPWFTVHVWKEQVIPIIVMVCICQYMATGQIFMRVLPYDYSLSLVIELAYVLLTCSDRPSRDDLIWLLPAQAFYNILKPAIHLWGVLTLFEHSWKTTFKVDSLSRRLWEVGPCLVWMSVIMACWGRSIAGWVNQAHRDLVSTELLILGLPVAFLPVWLYVFCADRYRKR